MSLSIKADAGNSVPQESLQNWPHLSPVWAKEGTEIDKGEERIVVLPFWLQGPVLSFLPSTGLL